MKIYNVYSTNNWHENSSREFCGCFDTIDAAVAHVTEYMIEHGADEYDYTEGWAVHFLYDHLQTQDRDVNTQFVIEEREIGKWVA